MSASSPPPVGPGEHPFDHVVKLKVDGQRLDQYLAAQFPDFSRSLIRKAIDAGTVTVNGAPAKASYKCRTGDVLRIWLHGRGPASPLPEDIPLDILYEDEYLALINKPPDMVVHPAKGHWSGTLVNAISFHFGAVSEANGDYRPGIVHRLDRDTSGVILIAKEERTHRDLGMMFERRKVFKEYVAITQGVLDRDSDYIEARIGHHPHDRTKMAITDDEEDEDAKDACTFYEVIERFGGYTLRAGSAADRADAPDSRPPGERRLPGAGRQGLQRPRPAAAERPGRRDCRPEQDEVLMPRQALHAHRLRFQHPRTGEWIEGIAPLPAEFERTLAALRTHVHRAVAASKG